MVIGLQKQDDLSGCSFLECFVEAIGSDNVILMQDIGDLTANFRLT